MELDCNDDLLFVGHQGDIKQEVDPASLIQVDEKGNKKKKAAVEYKVDVIVSLVSEGKMKVVATVEYKPDNREPEARTAQRDMYATNTISLHQRPCIGLDIAGGNDVANWDITAMAYFGNPRDGSPRFECSRMYNGQGMEALLKVANGLRNAAQGWQDDEINDEQRLGPVVARHEDRVFKVYDNAQYRHPNLHTLRRMLDDPSAKIWESEDNEVIIVDMIYRPCVWLDVPTGAFIDIMNKMLALHSDGMTHGDIRLANLLCSDGKGYIIDCDFVHQEFYPNGLQALTVDGKRHPDVQKAIDANDDGRAISRLKKETKHDIVALAGVMNLFACKEENSSIWKGAIIACSQSESLQDSIKILEQAQFKVGLQDRTILGL